MVQEGRAIADTVYRRAEGQSLRDARLALSELETDQLRGSPVPPRLSRHLQKLQRQLELDYLGVYEGDTFVHAIVDPLAGLADLPEPGRRFLVTAALDGEGVKILPPTRSGARLVLAAAADVSVPEPRPVVVVGRLLEPSLAEKSDRLIEAWQAYRQAELQRADITASQMLLFLMVTLLILLAASWVGLTLARRITVPLHALADGTRRIGGGDLEHRVEAQADDELVVLVDSFNRMTTELKRSRELLEQSNRELVDANRLLGEERAFSLAVLQNVAAGVVALDRDGRIVLCNGTALRLLRQNEEQVIGHDVANAWSDPERQKLAALVEEGRSRAATVGRELRLALGGEWKTFDVKISFVTLGGDDSENLGQVLVLEDLTELFRAQRTAAWTEAARRIAHEIKNPLTPIQLAAERALKHHQQKDNRLGQALEEGMPVIVREVETLKGMVDEFSRFARMPRPHPTEADLLQLVEETAGLYKEIKPGVRVEWQVEPTARQAWLDPEQIKSVLINLLDNAVEATDPPGSVTVSIDTKGSFVEIRVADTGPGITPEDRERLFQPHFSTKGRGTGLGLTITHRVVTEHHGTIRVENNEPQGTVFVVELPQSLQDPDVEGKKS